MTLQEAIENGKLGSGDGQNVSGFKHYMDVIDNKTLGERGLDSDWRIPYTYGSPPSFLRVTVVKICDDSVYFPYSTEIPSSGEINIDDWYLIEGRCSAFRQTIVWASNTTILVGIHYIDANDYGSCRGYIQNGNCWKLRVRAGWV